ncbi:MAG: regulatory protein RecX [Xanthomonadaceae bacterium]|nr:regulatory protein RecX [Xanthomonadaceae bacterium]
MTEPPGDDAGTGRPRRRRGTTELTPAQRALGLLVRREHSSKELTRKLRAKGVSRDDAKVTVARMTEAGWQSNERFAESLVRSRASQGHGPIRIRAELATHGLGDDAIRAALESVEEDWSRLAHGLVRRRFGEALHEDRALQRKAGEFLIRRGFSIDQMRRATGSSPFDDDFD